MSVTESEALAYCKRLTQTHYENFHVARFLLPRTLRIPFEVVYAYCRSSDDLADEHDGSEEARKLALERLNDWRQQLDDCFAQKQSEHPVFIALQKVVQQYSLPKEPFADLLTAFQRDQIQQRYATLEELLDYCRCSANPVGRIVLHLVCKPAQEELVWSDSICTGLQLANHWQDVKRDAKMGRCYIPKNVAEKFGIDLEKFQDSPAFRSMIRELAADARSRLLAGEPLIASVPKMIRTDIRLFLHGGLAILDAIEKMDAGVLIRRPVVSKWTKFRLFVRALLST
jgi:squalene synthase HpnC